MSDINEEKLKRFKSLGIPVPLPPINPEAMQKEVKNKDVAARLALLKSGKKKNEVNVFLEMEGKTKDFPNEIPTSKTKNTHEQIQEQRQAPGQMQNRTNKPKAPELESFAPAGAKFDDIEAMFFGGTSSSPVKSQAPITREVNVRHLPDETGAQFATEARIKLQERMAAKGIPVNTLSKPLVETAVHNGTPEGFIMISEEELKNKITQISAEVSKQMIKKFMTEYEKTTLNENKNIKKAEVIGQNIVKIDGKTFKLTPVALKA